MTAFSITYKLAKITQDPAPILDRIKGFESWWHDVDSVWMVATNMSPVEIRDQLWTAMGDAGQLLVVEVTGQSWAHAGVNDEGTAWLKAHVN
jgi:hypothetical protein